MSEQLFLHTLTLSFNNEIFLKKSSLSKKLLFLTICEFCLFIRGNKILQQYLKH